MPPIQEATVTPISKTPVWKWDISKLGILKIPISNSLSFKAGSNLTKLQKSTVSKTSLIQPVRSEHGKRGLSKCPILKCHVSKQENGA